MDLYLLNADWTIVLFFFCMCYITNLQVGNDQPKDVIEYSVAPKTEFQWYIRNNRKGSP